VTVSPIDSPGTSVRDSRDDLQSQIALARRAVSGMSVRQHGAVLRRCGQRCGILLTSPGASTRRSGKQSYMRSSPVAPRAPRDRRTVVGRDATQAPPFKIIHDSEVANGITASGTPPPHGLARDSTVTNTESPPRRTLRKFRFGTRKRVQLRPLNKAVRPQRGAPKLPSEATQRTRRPTRRASRPGKPPKPVNRRLLVACWHVI
jgi:hypothetical protein